MFDEPVALRCIGRALKTQALVRGAVDAEAHHTRPPARHV
jgi:hypothetical protein